MEVSLEDVPLEGAPLEERLAQLRRPEGTQPPADRRLDDSYTLDNDSLRTLYPSKWLDDGIIDAFFRTICLARPGECVTFDSTTLAFLLQQIPMEGATQEVFDDLYRPFRKLAATVTGNRGLVFMPFCIESHWILAVAHLKYLVIRVYDSLAVCEWSGRVDPRPIVQAILHCARATLSFCAHEDQWVVDHMWLPIYPNDTECGVYICMMALHHSWSPQFRPDDYVTRYRHWNGNLENYELDECYWLAGRRIILDICWRHFKSRDGSTGLLANDVAWTLDQAFEKYSDRAPRPEPQHKHQLEGYYVARSYTLQRLMAGVLWTLDWIGELGNTQFLSRREMIQQRAREVFLTPLGEPFRNEIVEEAVSYAWHDVEALRNLSDDLRRIRDNLVQEFRRAHGVVPARRPMDTDQMEEDTDQASSDTECGTSM